MADTDRLKASLAAAKLAEEATFIKIERLEQAVADRTEQIARARRVLTIERQ